MQETGGNSEARSSTIAQEVEVDSAERIGWGKRLRKVGVLVAALAAGGSFVIFLGNWLLGITVVLTTALRDEVWIGGRYAFVIILVIICPGWSWEEKRRRINAHTQIFIQVLERDFVKKFLKREVV